MAADIQDSFFPDVAPTARRRPHTDHLFLPRVLLGAAGGLHLKGPERDAAHQVLLKWADLESSGKLRKMNERKLQGEFLADVFGKALHYRLFSDNAPQWDLQPAYSINGGEADAAIGTFAAGQDPLVAAVIELKGPRVDLDRDRFNGRTPIEQGWDYLNDVRGAQWCIVSNIVSFRLYHHTHTRRQYEHFTLQELRDGKRFAEFYVLFERAGLLPPVLGHEPRAARLLYESDHAGQEVSDQLYGFYREKREDLIRLLTRRHGKPLDAAIRIAQKLLDRIIFICYCEQRGLIPAGSMENSWKQYSRFVKVPNPRWRNFLGLFEAMNQGNDDPEVHISRFNGKLFAHDPELDDQNLLDDQWTKYFHEISTYDFKGALHLDVLGHIFEKSIADLEMLRADPQQTLAAQAPSPGRRKREGIYYTPPHITRYLVDHTLGPVLDQRFAQLAQQFGIQSATETPGADKLADWIKFQEARLEALRSLRVLDPACGSGAFLIQAFDFLFDRYDEVLTALGRHQGEGDAEQRQQVNADILDHNLFGVDLSGESVEIARLALWIRTAEKGRTLADLSANIVQGNSLVDDLGTDPLALNYAGKFPAVFAAGGFDCVVSNPPYVKLQNFKKHYPQAAAWLPQRYRSAATGNFDLYLPFIERGLQLLRPGGRMGYIAPSVWVFNEYGRGLRELIAQQRTLSRFVDFKSFQVFDDATTYTALQFFTTTPQEQVAVADASSGNLARLQDFHVAAGSLGPDPWALVPGDEQGILDAMRRDSVTLDESSDGIIVGIQTSADAVYHLTRIGPGRYYSHALGRDVLIEDRIMKPLVSGEDASPFAVAPPVKHLLFPYKVTADGAALLSAKALGSRYKRAWAYLKENEKALRARESGKMNHDGWYAYNYPKNLDKQETPKLLVPRLLLHLFAAADAEGAIYLDNVDVGGVLPVNKGGLFFMLGLFNSRVWDFYWHMTSKPFRGEYRSANKQFIAPLPVPAGKSQKALARLAQDLTDLHRRRHEGLAKVHTRLITDLPESTLVATSPLPPKLPGVLREFDVLAIPPLLDAMEGFARRPIKAQEREDWQQYLTPRLEALQKLNQEIADLRNRLDAEVYTLFGLSGEQIARIEAATRPNP